MFIEKLAILLGYPFTCYKWIFASRHNQLGKGWHFFGVSTGGFASWALLIGSFFTSDSATMLLRIGGGALYLAMLALFVRLANQSQQQIDRIEAERFPWRNAKQPV